MGQRLSGLMVSFRSTRRLNDEAGVWGAIQSPREPEKEVHFVRP